MPLAADHRVEFAILFSASAAGKPRYPSEARIADFASVSNDLNLAAHICGRYSKLILSGEMAGIERQLKGFRRVQINTSDEVDIGAVTAWRDWVAHLAGHQIEVILQTRGAFPDDNRVSWLYDCSGGRGETPSAWPAEVPDGIRAGFAGRLGPDNVADAIRMMPDVNGSWIDMESRIRNERDLFDVGLCRRVCDNVRLAVSVDPGMNA